MTDVGVMQLVDTLDAGGTERVAVNLSNRLADRGFRSSLCTTRRDGPLDELVSPRVQRLSLGRKRTIQWDAIRRLVQYVRTNQIDILHAHGSSIATANLVSRFRPFPKILWHDHFGTNEQRERPVWLYRMLIRRVAGVAAVSNPLAQWSIRRLGFRADRVWCVPNFVDLPGGRSKLVHKLPGRAGGRIVCVANLRPVKDHFTLIQAMGSIAARHTDAHLILVGSDADLPYRRQIEQEIHHLGLEARVSMLGPRKDVPRILAGSDIGVLSSTSEGLPVSLLEYGAAALPVVVTDVGQCGQVVGNAGYVVPSSSPQALADALGMLLNDASHRTALGAAFQRRVNDQFGVDRVMQRWEKIYEAILEST